MRLKEASDARAQLVQENKQLTERVDALERNSKQRNVDGERVKEELKQKCVWEVSP